MLSNQKQLTVIHEKHSEALYIIKQPTNSNCEYRNIQWNNKHEIGTTTWQMTRMQISQQVKQSSIGKEATKAETANTILA
jgi:hypothetical protein